MFFPPNFPLYKAAMDAYSSNSKPAPNFDFENNQGFKDAMSEAFAKAMADKSNQAVRQRDKARGRLQRCTDRFVAERDAKEVALNATAGAEDARADADRARVGAEARLAEAERRLASCNERLQHNIALLREESTKRDDVMRVSMEVQNLATAHEREVQQPNASFDQTRRLIHGIRDMVAGMDLGFVSNLVGNVLNSIEGNIRMKEQCSRDIADLQRRLDEQLAAIQRDLDSRTAELDREREEHGQCKTNLRELTSRLTGVQEAKLEVQLELANLQGEHLEHLTSSQEKTTDFERRLEAMGSDLTNARRERDVATKGMNDAQTRLATCREQLRAATATLEEGRRINVKIQELAIAYSREAQRPNARFARVRILMTELQAMVSASPDTGGAVPSLAQSMLQYMQTSIDSQNDCSDQLEQTKNDLNAQIKTL